MNFDSRHVGPEAVTDEDRAYQGSRFSEVRAALFSTAYYKAWGGPDEPPLPVYEVTLRRALMGILRIKGPWGFLQAAQRSVASRADMRWGPDGRGFRRILHPNGVCLTGEWQIDDTADAARYSGYFKPGSRALIIGRYSVCCTETRRGRYRSQSLVGKLYPTTDRDHKEPLKTANFILQEDLGGTKVQYINHVELRNAPDTTPWRRGTALPVLLLTGPVLLKADAQPTIRQLYQIAELGKPEREATRTPEFMRLTVAEDQPISYGDDLDFRDEILRQIYDKGDPQPKRKLVFNIEVSNEGYGSGIIVRRRTIWNWKRIGRVVFQDAVASYNGDFVLHFSHAPWRNNRNDPSSLARSRR
jgi:hypothetical protein